MKHIIFLLTAMTLPVCSTIIETSSFQEILSHVSDDTLILLDIDDTLLITSQMLGSDEWLNHRTQQRKKTGIPSNEAFARSLVEWQAVRHITEMELVESGTNEIIRSLQAKGFPVMGLTTQGVTLAERTAHQLNIHQLDLSLSSPVKENHCLKIQNRNAFYIDGILYTSGASKADTLFTLFDKIGYVPRRIVFIDDKESHLKDVECAAVKKQIEFLGIRYAFSDARKNAFCPHIAHYQFVHATLEKLLSDDEAKALMQSE